MLLLLVALLAATVNSTWCFIPTPFPYRIPVPFSNPEPGDEIARAMFDLINELSRDVKKQNCSPILAPLINTQRNANLEPEFSFAFKGGCVGLKINDKMVHEKCPDRESFIVRSTPYPIFSAPRFSWEEMILPPPPPPNFLFHSPPPTPQPFFHLEEPPSPPRFTPWNQETRPEENTQNNWLMDLILRQTFPVQRENDLFLKAEHRSPINLLL